MTKIKTLACCALVAGLTLPVHAHDHELEPYLGLMGSYVHPDKARNLEEGPGAQLIIGLPINSYLSAEFNLFGHRADRELAAGRDETFGGGLDFRALMAGPSARIAPFLLVGGGVQHDGILGPNETAGYANAGGGLLWRLGDERRHGLRLEARRVAEFTDEIDPRQDRLYDTRISLGAEIPLGPAPQPEPMPAPAPAPRPPADSDGDGVLDNADLCPNTMRGTRVDARGCPVPKDSDGDGVLDGSDACADTPRGMKVDGRGCAIKEAVLILRNVNFEFDSSRLTPDAQAVLNGIVAGLRGQPSMELRIEGHTDSTGSDAYNLKLSRERAASVRSYLVEQGIRDARLTTQGYGESKPVASNDTEQGQAENRRVEFHVVKE